MGSAHAEIGVLEQARATFGSLKGETIFMNVSKLPCGYCLGDVAAEAKLLELNYLRINTVNPINGYPTSYFWRPGMNTLQEIGLRESFQGIPYTWQMIKQGL
jgi:hypothetical protein